MPFDRGSKEWTVWQERERALGRMARLREVVRERDGQRANGSRTTGSPASTWRSRFVRVWLAIVRQRRRRLFGWQAGEEDGGRLPP